MRRRTFFQVATQAGLAPWLLGEEEPEAGRPAKIADIRVIKLRHKSGTGGVKRYLQIATDAGATGIAGGLYVQQAQKLNEQRERLLRLLGGKDPRSRQLHSQWLWKSLYPSHPLRAYAEGRDPLTGAPIWGTRRRGRHTETGFVVMALSAVDNALWDLRGKLAGQPVSRLLGATRTRLRAYISCMPSRTLQETRRRARILFERGFTRQKWFLRHGPPGGKAGFRANVGLVEGLRNEVGPKAHLMFDFAVGQRGRCDWDVPYAVAFVKAVEPYSVYWLEEPFSPEEIDSYARLRDATDIPLATGEHTNSRWNIQPFLERRLIRFVQCDPEWTGGVSELLAICALAQRYPTVKVIPHGHHILAAAHVVASQKESLCPMVEYGEGWMPGRQRFQVRAVKREAGVLTVPPEPGLGPDLDWNHLTRV